LISATFLHLAGSVHLMRYSERRLLVQTEDDPGTVN